MARLRYWIRDRYATILNDAPIRLRAEHYQRYYDDNRVGAALVIPRMALAGFHHSSGDDIFASYPEKRFFDRQGIEKELRGYEMISFDIFDTLLLRRVNKPKDVFAIMESENKLSGFAQKREFSESLAREKKFASAGTREVTIDDIYQMPEMRIFGSREDLIELELAVEKRCCYANPEMLNIFEQLLSAGKSIVVTSDMYLHTEFIRELLDDCGYRGIEAYFISGDYSQGKGNGGLFKAVLEYASKRRTAHIGGNFFGDVYPLKGSNITPFHYLSDKREKKEEKH